MQTQLIAILTDSTCDIPDELIQQDNIQVIPQIIIRGIPQYLDWVDLQPKEFYERMKTDPVSAAMSGSCQMALNAAKLINLPVQVVDGKGPTGPVLGINTWPGVLALCGYDEG